MTAVLGPPCLTEKDIARFWSKVDRSGEHWLYLGGLDADGYGCFSIKHKPVKAHHMAYILAYGEIPMGHHILHLPPCDIKNCVRHLYAGTPKNNGEDRKRMGTAKTGNHKGEKNGRCRLYAGDILDMRKRHSNGDATAPALAVEYGIDRSYAYDIVAHRVWRHI